MKGAPITSGKNYEIPKRLDRLRDRQEAKSNNSNNNNSNNISPRPSPPSLLPLAGPSSGPFIPPPPPFILPPSGRFLEPFEQSNNLGNFNILAQTSSFDRPSSFSGPSSNLFGSQTAILTREKEQGKFLQDNVQKELDDTIYELLDPPNMGVRVGFLNALGVEANDVLDKEFITKQEETDAALQQIKQEYNFDDIRETFDEGIVHPKVDFFYGGDNDNFIRAIKFLSPSSDNREFIAFLLLDLAQKVMNSNSLSIHIESGDTFYQNFYTGGNFYNFLMAQKYDETAFVPQKNSYRNSFEKNIGSFLPSFSIDDIERFD